MLVGLALCRPSRVQKFKVRLKYDPMDINVVPCSYTWCVVLSFVTAKKDMKRECSVP